MPLWFQLPLQVSESLYGVISCGHQVAALEAGKGSPPLSVLDTQLLLNFLVSNDALRWGRFGSPSCREACVYPLRSRLGKDLFSSCVTHTPRHWRCISWLRAAHNLLDLICLQRRGGETFVPVCLPGFNDAAYLHAYVACLDAHAGVFLALLSGGSDAFSRLAGGPAGVCA